jgi:ribonuclease HII
LSDYPFYLLQRGLDLLKSVSPVKNNVRFAEINSYSLKYHRYKCLEAFGKERAKIRMAGCSQAPFRAQWVCLNSCFSRRCIKMVASADELIEQSLTVLRELFLVKEHPVPEGFLNRLDADARRGARQLASLIRKRRSDNRRETRRLHQLLRFERELWEQGLHLIAGIDEAGMAPLAGPVVAAAVILPLHYKLPGLDDSKKIPDERKRSDLALVIKRDAVCWAVGRAEVEEIDSLNIYHAGLLSMRRAMEGLQPKPEYLLVDARTIPHCEIPQKGIIHGDALSASIAAASIIAKTTRDAHMIEMDRIYAGYGFASHKGYPTIEHLNALRTLGPLPIHRRSFGPVREALRLDPVQGKLF